MRRRGKYTMKINMLGFASIVVLISLLVACGQQAPTGPNIRVENVWSRPSSAMQPSPDGMHVDHKMTETMAASPAMGATGAVYLKVLNEGGQADRLTGAKSDVAATVEIHESLMENNVMKMRPVTGGLEIPAGGQVELKPGGYHVMLMGLKRDLKPGDAFTVTLQLDKSGELPIQSTVRQP